MAKSKNDNNHRKYPIASWDRCGPKMIIQCMLKMKAAPATHADHRRTDDDPRSATHGEHTTKNSVVATLPVASTAWCIV